MGHLTGCTAALKTMYYFEDIIGEIEKGLTGEISISALAKKANMSVYEFRRIFTFVAKIPINEYIRKRRLSLAAVELSEKRLSVTEIAFKYRYDNSSSFSRAFKEYHGVSPTEVRDGRTAVKMLSPIGADIITTGGIDISYKLIEDTDFCIYGFSGDSDLSDTECCENVWQGFYESDYSELITDDEMLYVSYTNSENSVRCIIGRRDNSVGAADSIHIPSSKWVSFKLYTTEDEAVNRFYKEVLTQWLLGVGYVRNNKLPNIEIYPADMDEDGFEWEIRIPVKKEDEQGV